MRRAPFVQLAQRGGCLRFRRMKEIPQKDQLLAGITRQQGVESLQVGLGGAVGHRLPKSTVGSGFADVNIGDQ